MTTTRDRRVIRERCTGDVHTPGQRSYNMARIRSRDTKPEMMLRKALFARGHRYRIAHGLPGKPDIVFVTRRLVVFVDGCFWHRCPVHYRAPSTNAAFWEAKIGRNVHRDIEVTDQLTADGWRVLRFWEHRIIHEQEQVIAEIESLLAQGEGRLPCRW